jgi:hypothetical protein
LLALLEPIHQHGVVSRLNAGPGLRVVTYLVQALLFGLLNGIETGIRADAQPFVRSAGGVGVR